jgi:hypothetical protein
MKGNAATELIKVFLTAFFDGKIESGKIAEGYKEYTELVWAEIDDAYGSR